MRLSTLIILSLIFATASNTFGQESEIESAKSQAQEIVGKAIQSEQEQKILEDSTDSPSDQTIRPEPDDQIKETENQEAATKRTSVEEAQLQDKRLEEEKLEELDKETAELAPCEVTPGMTAEEFEKIVPLSIGLNENGELVGTSYVRVNNTVQPVEANITIVKDGVLVTRLYSDEDGSFAFPNIEPGQYNMYGSASAYAVNQPFTLYQQGSSCSACCDCMNLKLSHASSANYSTLSSAPATSFSGGFAAPVSGGFAAPSGGAFFGGGGGGGFFSGGGGASFNAGRLLRIGGIATAISLGVSGGDDASPTE